MEALLAVAAASFGLGALGYLIVRFWIIPIRRYRLIKGRLCRGLAACSAGAPVDASHFGSQAVQLSDLYNADLPPWYRMLLGRRRESPIEASRHLMRLAATRNPEHIRRRAEQVRRTLRLP